jgi:hypothetical protein
MFVACSRGASQMSELVLQAVVTERLDFAPFDDGELRGYQFSGTGSYGDELLGDTCPTSNGGPNGIWQPDVFAIVQFEGVAMVA